MRITNFKCFLYENSEIRASLYMAHHIVHPIKKTGFADFEPVGWKFLIYQLITSFFTGSQANYIYLDNAMHSML